MANDAFARLPAAFVGSGPNGQMTESEARALLDELSLSGETLRGFSAARGFKSQRLSWWKSKFAAERSPSAPQRTSARAKGVVTPLRFVPILAAEPSATKRVAPTAALIPSGRAAYELALGDALTLRIPHDFHDDSLARIVRVLRGTR